MFTLMVRNDLSTLMIEVGHISKHYRELAKLTGEDFNIFKTLKLESSEVRLHSAILTDLLSPLGSHGQSDLFLKIFVKQQGVSEFDTKSANAEFEKNTGIINSDFTKGGRIDILITDKQNRKIIIENKIYAGDQKNQLLRYYNYDNEANLFYLNLDGTKPSDLSTNDILKDDNYKVISYSYHIINWLEECKRAAVSLPIIRETIAQYINLLKSLTNQTTQEIMKNEIKKILSNNPGYLHSIELCQEVIESTIHETKAQFEALFASMFPPQEILSDGEISIKVEYGEDGDGVYFGYKAFKGDENISNYDLAKKYTEIFKDCGYEVYSNDSWVAWIHPFPFKRYQKFKALDKKDIFRMNADPEYLKNFVSRIIEIESEFRKEFLTRLNMKSQYNPIKQPDNSL